MDKCPICMSNDTSADICRCGYHFEKEEVIDADKLRAFFSKVKENEVWPVEVRLIRNLHVSQQKKHGKTMLATMGGWTIRRTAKLLNIRGKSSVHESIKLANAVDEDPILLKFKKKTHALKNIGKSVDGFFQRKLSKGFDSERKLHKYLVENWGSIRDFQEWDLKNSYLSAGEAGELDLLARNKTDRSWLVVELKKEGSSDRTVGQVRRYMGWVKENRAGKNQGVSGLIISGYPPGKRLCFALNGMEDVDLKIYYLENDKVKLMTLEEVDELVEKDNHFLDQAIKLLKDLKIDT